jgi:hypothetical protein
MTAAGVRQRASRRLDTTPSKTRDRRQHSVEDDQRRIIKPPNRLAALRMQTILSTMIRET